MQHKHRRVRRRVVDLLERRHPAFRKLEFRPPADNAHPLRRRRATGLLLEHGERGGQRRHSVPSQFHVEVEAASDEMQMRVVEARNHPASAEIDHLCLRTATGEDVGIGADRRNPAPFDRHGFDLRMRAIQSRDLAVMKNDVGVHSKTSAEEVPAHLSTRYEPAQHGSVRPGREQIARTRGGDANQCEGFAKRFGKGSWPCTIV